MRGMESVYFLAGYFYSGLVWFVVVLQLLRVFRQVDRETSLKVQRVPMVVLGGLAVLILFAYGMEISLAYYSGATYEYEAFKLRVTGPYWWSYLLMLLHPLLIALYLFPRVRENLRYVLLSALFALLANSGWFERGLIRMTADPSLYQTGDEESVIDSPE